MKLSKSETKPSAPSVRVELELERLVAEQLKAMEEHTKMSRSELANIALKRFISAHKDYFPENYTPRDGD